MCIPPTDPHVQHKTYKIHLVTSSNLYVIIMYVHACTHLCAYNKCSHNIHYTHSVYDFCGLFMFVRPLLHLELFAIPKVEELAGQPMFVNWAFSCLSANGKGAAALGRDSGMGDFVFKHFRESIAIY